MFTLLATFLAASPVADTARAANPAVPAPPIQITLNNGGNFLPGGVVNVRVQTTDDGYMVVFRVDGDGRIRVIFPLDPDGDAFVRGGKEYELRGRGERSTFLADDRGGSGMVYAAISPQPLVVRDFSLNGHWDYDALRLADSSTDAENDLNGIVSRMVNRAHFDYDALGYRVQDVATVAAADGGGYYPGLYDPYYNPRWRCMSCGWGYPGSQFTVDFGYSPFWDPWLYSPWGYNYGYGYGYGYGYRDHWFPVVVNPHPLPSLPAGTRARPRPNMPPIGGSGMRNAPPGARSAPPPSAGTRSRPRPSDMPVTAPRNSRPNERPVFRQPPQGPPAGAGNDRPRNDPPPQSRPRGRDAPPVYRAPPPPPPPSSSSSGSGSRSSGGSPPPQHSSPPAPPPRSRPGGGHR